MKLHFGSGLEVASDWWNCDGSPTLFLQRLPLVGFIFRLLTKPRFPTHVQYGNIVRGLRIQQNSCDLAYCSHVLEHLALEDCRHALRNTFCYLKPGGVFRLVVPDLEQDARYYLSSLDSQAAMKFMSWTHLGRERRPAGFVALIKDRLGNSHHLWMWDFKAMSTELESIGFVCIRRCQFGDANNPAFAQVENPARFQDALAIECVKPTNSKTGGWSPT